MRFIATAERCIHGNAGVDRLLQVGHMPGPRNQLTILTVKSPYDIGLSDGLAGRSPEQCPYTDPGSGQAWLEGRDAGADLRSSIAADHARLLPDQVEAVSGRCIEPPSNYVAPPWWQIPQRGSQQ